MSKIMYKLVSKDWTTHGGMKWEIGKTNCATKPGTEMCTNQVLHCYNDPRLVVIFNPIHANISGPHLLEIRVDKIVNSDGLKFASKEQTPIKEIEPPKLSLNQKVAFAIKCALLVYKEASFVSWANNWLGNVDRSDSTAAAAYDYAAAAYAARAAAYAAAYAAYAAAYAAAAYDYAAAATAYAAAYAARAAAYAARAAAYAAAYAAAAYDYAAAARAADSTAYAAGLADNKVAADNTLGDKFIEIIDWVMENIE
jgi:hypothetical protein